MIEMKHCRKCGCDKPADREHWYFNKSKPMGPCKTCRREIQRERRRDPHIKALRQDYDKERDRIRKSDSEYLAWRRQYIRDYSRERYRTDPKVNLDRRIKGAIAKSLRKKCANKTSPKADILGWTIEELIDHLESLFEDGMSWENMGDWHIDHIIPLSAVGCESENDPLFKMVWSLRNLAPLWAKDNLEKNANVHWQLPDSYKNPKLRELYEDRDYALAIFG